MEEQEREAPQEEPRPTSRRRFLRSVGVTLLAAVGAGALAKSAFAIEGQCCRDCSCGTCMDGCYCTCDCGSAGTYCYTGSGGCILSSSTPCGHLCPC
jgi:hypothetical protein